ncbi:MAG TPA: hypothetical protein VEU31_04210 [Candidatus Acidoferrales bacterium]|nr:hypothetical protein [Candidatus Acidoferrales bacterium]
MKKLFASLTLVAFLAVSGLAYAQAGGGSTGEKKDDTKKSEGKKEHKGGKKGHKGGKKGKKGSGGTTTTPPSK